MKLVTGANGFVGSAVIAALKRKQLAVRGAVRSSSMEGCVTVGDIGSGTNWLSALAGVDTVIHTAARVHVMADTASDPIAAFRHVNVEGTRRLAEQAAQAGVNRLIFISSIKVNGETTSGSQGAVPFSSFSPASPVDTYGQSKWEAEQALHEIASRTGLEVVIIRPVLVYGPGVKANFHAMMRWLYKGVPLPFGAIHNKRSLVALDNLVDLIVTCIDHPEAANQTFLVSDGEDMSTSELLMRMGESLSKPARLLPVPEILLRGGALLLGRRDIARRLTGSLQVDIKQTKSKLDWIPPVSVDDALKRTAEEFLLQKPD
ncbi:MAG: SDR family oxidoreductase [Gammaproteobacteria bacterium]|nr:SDR family oxidoreductase [Gammaproteobacteria bacterium]